MHHWDKSSSGIWFWIICIEPFVCVCVHHQQQLYQSKVNQYRTDVMIHIIGAMAFGADGICMCIINAHYAPCFMQFRSVAKVLCIQRIDFKTKLVKLCSHYTQNQPKQADVLKWSILFAPIFFFWSIKTKWTYKLIRNVACNVRRSLWRELKRVFIFVNERKNTHTHALT